MSKKRKKKPNKRSYRKTKINRNKANLKAELPPILLEKYTKYIELTFGDIETVFHSVDPRKKLHVDIFVVPPDSRFPYWKLITVGMSRYKQNLPDLLKDDVLDRSELVLLLEPDWTYEGLFPIQDPHIHSSVPLNENKDNNYFWPLLYLQNIAEIPLREGSCTYPGDVFEFGNSEEFTKTTKLKNVAIKPLPEFKTNFNGMRLSGNEFVEFYQAVFITDEETKSLLKVTDVGKRVEMIEKIDPIVHPNRDSIDLS